MHLIVFSRQSQNVLIEAIGHENFKFRDAQLLKEVSDIVGIDVLYMQYSTNYSVAVSKRML